MSRTIDNAHAVVEGVLATVKAALDQLDRQANNASTRDRVSIAYVQDLLGHLQDDLDHWQDR